MDDDENEISPEEFVSMLADVLENTDDSEIVPATPWSSYDTTAVAMMFAANISLAAGDFFRNLSILALGQSANDIEAMDNKEFSESMLRTLGMIPETKAPDGDKDLQ